VSPTDGAQGVAGGAAPDPAAPKAAWRAWARAVRRAWAADPARRAADGARVRSALAAWGPWRASRLALVYVAFGDELDPLPDDGPAGPRLATTRTLGPRRPLELHDWVPPLQRHPFGFLQPGPDAPRVEPAAIDLVLVPGLAFDVRGGRLGQGQGHYDRLLPVFARHVPTVGVTLDALVVPRVPREPHDVAVTHLLTPSGLRPVEGA
jgi:5-formyltetrahydrofolate cyclo-ligase